MSDTSNKRNLIIAGVIVLAVLIAGYFYATRDRSSDALLVSTTATSTASSVDSGLLSTLLQLKRLRLDDSIFSNQSWLSLSDLSQPIPPQVSGRPNPFSPLEAAVFATSTASTR